MKQRYNQWMKGIRPSETFLNDLESTMNRELHRSRTAYRQKRQLRRIGYAAAAVLALALAVTFLRGVRPDRQSSPPVLTQGITQNAKDPNVTDTSIPKAVPPTPAPTNTPEPDAVLPFAMVQPTPAPESTPETDAVLPLIPAQPTPTPKNTLEPGATPLVTARPTPLPETGMLPYATIQPGVQMHSHPLDQGAWPNCPLKELEQSLDRSIDIARVALEIHVRPDPDSALLDTLEPGQAYWPVRDTDNSAELSNENRPFAALEILWWDGEVLQKGWCIFPVSDQAPDPLPLEIVRLPGKTNRDAELLYDCDKAAPIADTLQEGQMLCVYAQSGEWIYVTTLGFDTLPRAGWLPADAVWTLEWRDPGNLLSIDLLADRVHFRDRPDGNAITTLSKTDAESLIYLGVTLPGKNGDWHCVTYRSKQGAATGCIAADYSQIHTLCLGDELNLDDVIQATLRRRATDNYPDIQPFEQALTGEALTGLLDRLREAFSETSYEHVCAHGILELRLTHANGRVDVLPLAADGCPSLSFNGLQFSYRTRNERIQAFLNDGGVSGEDILPEYFDQFSFVMN